MELLKGPRHLAPGDPDATHVGLPEQPHPRQITAGERLLDPQHRELVEAVEQLPHVGWAEPGSGVAGHPPPLV